MTRSTQQDRDGKTAFVPRALHVQYWSALLVVVLGLGGLGVMALWSIAEDIEGQMAVRTAERDALWSAFRADALLDSRGEAEPEITGEELLTGMQALQERFEPSSWLAIVDRELRARALLVPADAEPEPSGSWETGEAGSAFPARGPWPQGEDRERVRRLVDEMPAGERAVHSTTYRRDGVTQVIAVATLRARPWYAVSTSPAAQWLDARTYVTVGGLLLALMALLVVSVALLSSRLILRPLVEAAQAYRTGGQSADAGFAASSIGVDPRLRTVERLLDDLQRGRLARERLDVLEEMIETLPVPVMVGEEAGRRITAVNQAFIDTLGYTADDLPDVDAWWLRAYPDPEMREMVRRGWEGMIALAPQDGGQIGPVESRITTRSGQERIMQFVSTSAAGRRLVVLTDLTELRETERALTERSEELEESRTIYREIFEKNSDGVLLIYDDGRVTFDECNEAAVRLLGYERKEDLLGRTPWDLSPEFQPDGQPSRERARAMLAHAQEEGAVQFEWVHRTADGEHVWFDIRLTRIRIRSQSCIHIVWRDISDRKALEEKLEHEATHDPLTGVHNRRSFEHAFSREIARIHRGAGPLSLLVLDIDHFKPVNDAYGHAVGDAILAELCNRITALLRASDLLARWGGEEFVVLLPETDAEGAAQLAERIRGAVVSRSFAPSGGGEGEAEPPTIPVTVSIGAATYGHGDDAGALFHRADAALYEAKESGRNRVVHAD